MPGARQGPKTVKGALQSDPNYVSRLGLGPVANVCRGRANNYTIRYDTRCCFNVRSKADNMSQLNLPQYSHASGRDGERNGNGGEWNSPKSRWRMTRINRVRATCEWTGDTARGHRGLKMVQRCRWYGHASVAPPGGRGGSFPPMGGRPKIVICVCFHCRGTSSSHTTNTLQGRRAKSHVDTQTIQPGLGDFVL